MKKVLYVTLDTMYFIMLFVLIWSSFNLIIVLEYLNKSYFYIINRVSYLKFCILIFFCASFILTCVIDYSFVDKIKNKIQSGNYVLSKIDKNKKSYFLIISQIMSYIVCLILSVLLFYIYSDDLFDLSSSARIIISVLYGIVSVVVFNYDSFLNILNKKFVDGRIFTLISLVVIGLSICLLFLILSGNFINYNLIKFEKSNIFNLSDKNDLYSYDYVNNEIENKNNYSNKELKEIEFQKEYHFKDFIVLRNGEYFVEDTNNIYKYKMQLSGIITNNRKVIFTVLSNIENLNFKRVKESMFAKFDASTVAYFMFEDKEVELVDMIEIQYKFDVYNEKQSDKPYKYPLKKDSILWNNLEAYERKEYLKIDINTARGLTTKALLDTILDNPYIIDIFAYDSVDMGIKTKNEQYQFMEFFFREDAEEVLRFKYNTLLNELGINVLDDLDEESLNYLMSEDMESLSKLNICSIFLSFYDEWKNFFDAISMYLSN